MVKERVYPSALSCFQAAAEQMGIRLIEVLEKMPTAHLLVCGGSTAKSLLPLLAGQPVEWGKVEVSLADERKVAHDSSDRNEALVEEAFKGAGAQLKRVNGLVDVSGQALVVPKPLPHFHLAFLGMGEDGHIASLFPGGAELIHSGLAPIETQSPKPPFGRVSWPPQALLACDEVFLVVCGAEKRRTLTKARQPGPLTEYPVRLLLDQTETPVNLCISD